MFPKSKTGKIGLFAHCVLSGALTGAVVAAPAQAAGGDEDFAPYEGRVVAKRGVVLRTGPSNDYRAVGSKRYGTVVAIACRLNGQEIEGNPVWYKLDDASYAWSSVRHIVHDGADPRWC
ncbi:hypothetical protein ACH4TE_08790 [Streptomyces sioyaensis]|uniref:hypothetical protein n=1 Tax=Streptomyces sioyaensis TaxID=67364 RepID=UPI0037AE3D86